MNRGRQFADEYPFGDETYERQERIPHLSNYCQQKGHGQRICVLSIKQEDDREKSQKKPGERDDDGEEKSKNRDDTHETSGKKPRERDDNREEKPEKREDREKARASARSKLN